MNPDADTPAAAPTTGMSRPAPGFRIDSTVAHPARRYNYWLGGKDNFGSDRESGDRIAAAFPHIRTAVQENRRFLHRAVAYLAGEAGIGQFLDIGTGIPAEGNTHEVAQRINPRCRVVYADNDPIVLAHARALLTSSPAGATAYLDADLRDPDHILTHPDLAGTLDLGRPVALMLIAILHFLTDDDDPYRIVTRLVAALPPGSYLAISHTTYDFLPPETIAALDAATTGEPFRARTRDQVARFFDGLDLVEPGIVPTTHWRPAVATDPQLTAIQAAAYAAVARIP